MRSTVPTLSVVGTLRAPTEGDEPLDEIEADLAVIEAAVDVGRDAIDEPFGANRRRVALEEAHGERGRWAVNAAEQVVVRFGKLCRTASAHPGTLVVFAVSARCSAARSASAEMVAVGLTAPLVTMTLPSTMKRLATS